VLTIDEGFAFIGVKGDCHIHGTINADGKGCQGVANEPGEGATYVKSKDAVAIASIHTLDSITFSYPFHFEVFYKGYAPLVEQTWNYDSYLHACGGAGGGGYAHDGGGAGGPGGTTSVKAAAATPAAIVDYMDDILSAGCAYAIYTALFYGRGGAGGGDDTVSSVGHGGGVIYIEVEGELIFDGELTADGTAGGSQGHAWSGCGGGGTIIVRAKTITTNSGTVTVAKGTNGASYNGADGYSAIVAV
jgi:hypothetical protein